MQLANVVLMLHLSASKCLIWGVGVVGTTVRRCSTVQYSTVRCIPIFPVLCILAQLFCPWFLIVLVVGGPDYE